MLPADPARRHDGRRARRAVSRSMEAAPVMFFFSNRLGCMGSVVVSVVGTLILLLILGVINLN
jgi:hypothetical protein